MKNAEKPRLLFYFIMCLFFVTTQNLQSSAQSKKPNIIFILSDDIGYKVLSVNGSQSYNTPNLDSMAQQGMNFTECHATPLCSPSRVMLLTGKYNFRNYTAWGIMDTGQKTIANMLKDAGYTTGCFGKWQLDGGDASITKFGFDSYCVWNPFDTANYYGYRYKNPVLYTHKSFISDSLTQNKYGEDIVVDSLLNFIQNNRSKPFFIYYPMLLAHPPFQPTPDDTAFASWNFPKKSDTSFYTSMIEYMDKKIGDVINKLKQLGLSKNTIIIFTGDNGTPAEITEQTIDGDDIGGKDSTTEAGTHVPLIIDCPKIIKPGSVNNDLIGFTDFLPTLAHAAGIPVPANYGTLDGVDFYPRLKGNPGTPRDWLFYDFDPHPGIDSLKRWAQTKEYKLYDTSLFNSNRPFYDIITDPNELDSIPHNMLTSDEISIKQKLLQVINSYIKQGTPILSKADIVNISDSSVTLEDSILINGGSTIKNNGIVWSQNPGPVYPSSAHASDTTFIGPFQSTGKGLKVNTVYYVKAFAKNIAGVSYSNEIKFRTLFHSPLALAATSVNNTGFIAHWHSISVATRYKLYVSTKPNFVNIKPGLINQQFNHGIILPAGWALTGSIGENDTIHNAESPTIQFKTPGAQLIAKQLGGPATELKFWIKGLSTDTLSYFLVEGFNGKNWVPIKIVQPISRDGITRTFDSSSGIPLPPNIIQFRFTYYKSKGTLAFDDLYIKYNTITNAFVNGYSGLTVNDTSSLVTGLKAGTTYYYRVKAFNSYNNSDNSNTIAATTCASPDCNQNAIANEIGNNIKVFPNPSSKDFTLVVSKTNSQVEIDVTDVNGKTVYQTKDFNNHNFVFGKNFAPGIYFVRVIQDGNSKTLKLVKQ